MRFGVVGLLAACVHYMVAISLLNLWSLSIGVSNLIGFLLAFWVSFFGHHYFSFQIKQQISQESLLKFLLVASMGFVLNESLVLSLHHATSLSLQQIVIIAIAITACITFFLNKLFSFQIKSKA